MDVECKILFTYLLCLCKMGKTPKIGGDIKWNVIVPSPHDICNVLLALIYVFSFIFWGCRFGS